MTAAFSLILNPGTVIAHPDVLRLFDSHLVLSHVLQQAGDVGEDVASIYCEVAEAGIPVILDNGAEERAEFNAEYYLSLISLMRPTIAVLPDIKHCRRSSFTASMAFVEDAESVLCDHEIPRWMVVPQASSMDEMVESCLDVYRSCDPERFVVGIPIRSGASFEDGKMVHPADYDYRRKLLMERVLERSPDLAHTFDHHLLGCGWYPGDTAVSTAPNLMSLDTTKPMNTSANGIRFLPSQGRPQMVDARSLFASVSLPLLASNVKDFCGWWRLRVPEFCTSDWRFKS